ncbi:MAG: hypothetical protein H6823_26275 [Planctomycetaceae bacterium]|nr:hypothetical protein [Planctomycetaceae bacterium]
MYEAIGRGLTLWARNIPLLSAITLTVWLPGNIAINYVASQSDSDTVTPADFWLPTGIETIFGPLCVGAVIYALDRRWQARRVGYVESMRAGFRCWGRLFITTLLADFLVGLSCLLLVVPGIILALRYSLIGMAVVLEGRSGDSARSRSTSLMRGRMWGVFGIVVVSYGFLLGLVGALYLALAFVYESTPMTDFQYSIGETVVDSLLDVLSVPVLAMLFCIFVQASGRETELEVVIEQIAEETPHAPFDNSNPYHPPSSQ